MELSTLNDQVTTEVGELEPTILGEVTEITGAVREKRMNLSRVLRLLCLPLLSVGLVVGLAAPAYAEVVINQQVPVSGTFTNPCNGDVFPLAGNIHIVFHVTVDSNGGLHIFEMENAYDIKSVAPAVPSGSDYVVTATLTQSVNLTSGAAEEATFTQHVNVISQGPAQNFLMHVTLHITLANGVPTAQVNDMRTECAG